MKRVVFVVWLLGSLQKSYKTNDSIGVHTDRGGCCLPYKTPRRRGRGSLSKPCWAETLFETGSHFRQTDGAQHAQLQPGRPCCVPFSLPALSTFTLAPTMTLGPALSRRIWGFLGCSPTASHKQEQAESALPCSPKAARSSPVIDLFLVFFVSFPFQTGQMSRLKGSQSEQNPTS